MHLLVNFDGHRSYKNKAINSYINFYMNTSGKPELDPSIEIRRFKIRSTNLEFRSSVHNLQKNEKKKKKKNNNNTGN